MEFNLWRSEDSQYTLRYRMGAANPTEQAVTQPTAAIATEPGQAEMDRIDYLMQKVARQLDARPA